MPPRRSHTKSRNGCDMCKKRRVKCDEQGPPCSNCISRELKCTYSKTPVARGMSSIPSTPATVDSFNEGQFPSRHYQQIPNAPSNGATNFSDVRNLELMHKYSTDTYQSLCNDPSDLYVWQIVIPRKALSHDFLMGGILAIASLHIASTMEAPDALTYINTALEYHNQALTPFRHAINDINPENCEAVFAHSVVTTIIGIALPHLTTKREESSSMTENIAVVFELLQGVSNIHRISRTWSSTRLFTTGSQGDNFFVPSGAEIDKDTQAALNHLDTLTDNMMSNAEEKRIVKEALAVLRRCFIRYINVKDIASILAWLAIVHKEFVEALGCRQPFALLVLMYWGVLLHEIDGKAWWARNSGSALVLELLTELQAHDAPWENALLWPKQKIGLRGPPPTTTNNYKKPR